ncbi:hypothetical protein AnigIFM63604_003420 [Aspergillus niger]|uniref:Uncharacterized protein n=2 Tax=Aspergillus TaxID=5052 RepID=A0A370PZX4_ASPPH|nr:hypothetical protein CBS147346_123 [Aspergillus niger]RDK47728.1 hypothetical protein M752DRAFT_271973 [Aspergillus phoenicis ATCC 13157]GLA48275.1 hypothetical protein AnigIFM63604_003420 [Aspergillus niger]
MSYEVFTAEYLGQPNHVAIYIETEPNADEKKRAGKLFHVVGSILMGMNFEKRSSKDPQLSTTYVPHTKKKIGTIAKGDLEKFETECCNAVAPPGSQVTLRGKPKDPSKPLYRCNHWLDDVTKLALQKGILKP